MSDPNWQRLLRVVAQDLAGRCVISGHAAELGSTWSAFTSNSATGGGTNSDIKSCMTSLFEAIQLGMKDKTILLLTTYAVLKESDLLWSPLTWRLMLVTAIGAAAEKVLVGAEGAAGAAGSRPPCLHPEATLRPPGCEGLGVVAHLLRPPEQGPGDGPLSSRGGVGRGLRVRPALGL